MFRIEPKPLFTFTFDECVSCALNQWHAGYMMNASISPFGRMTAKSPSDKHTTSDSLFLINSISAEQPEKMVSAKKIRKNFNYLRSSMAISCENVNSDASSIVWRKTFYERKIRCLRKFIQKNCNDFGWYLSSTIAHYLL